jgi:hypothetical protein
MKTTTQFFPLLIAIMIISMAGNANAQGRGHQKSKERHGADHPNKHDRHKHGWHSNGHDHHRHGERQVRVVHYHHEPVVVRHYHERPRYIYYRDYDVYYDFQENVYFSYSGRNWTVSASLPVVLRRVDTRRAVRMEVDYDRDDFHAYLASSRPVYRRMYTGY